MVWFEVKQVLDQYIHGEAMRNLEASLIWRLFSLEMYAIKGRLMSALGHKRTFAMQKCMSALPPKADMCSAQAHVRFVPKADIGQRFGLFNPALRIPSINFSIGPAV